jgi:hypothetical protein
MSDNQTIPLSTIQGQYNRGIDPHLTVCTNCGKDTNSLTVGELWKAKNQYKNWVYFYRRDRRKIEKELQFEFKEVIRVGPHERIPFGLCDECETEIHQFEQIVQSGGAYWHCKECHQSGVLKPCEYVDHIRQANAILAPKPIGIEFDSCKQHSVEH